MNGKILCRLGVAFLLATCCACASNRTLELDAAHPAIRMTNRGALFCEEFVRPQEIPGILEDYDVPHDRVIHILLDPDVTDLGAARTLMGCLGKAGYKRPVLVTKRHAESFNLGKPKGKGR